MIFYWLITLLSYVVTLGCNGKNLEGKTQYRHLAKVSYTQVVWNIKHKEWPLNDFITQIKH